MKGKKWSTKGRCLMFSLCQHGHIVRLPGRQTPLEAAEARTLEDVCWKFYRRFYDTLLQCIQQKTLPVCRLCNHRCFWCFPDRVSSLSPFVAGYSAVALDHGTFCGGNQSNSSGMSRLSVSGLHEKMGDSNHVVISNFKRGSFPS